MPPLVKEISSGNQVSRSSNEGQLADTATRVFRLVLSSPGESFDIQATCGVRIGDAHPVNGNVFCSSIDARFDGDSRMVMLCSFQYQSTASAGSSGGGADPKSQAPDVRPPNWTTSTSLIEQPVNAWRPRTFFQAWGGADIPAVNPAGDMYDGVTKLVSLVNISITVFNPFDPTEDNQTAGYVNRFEITLGSLRMSPHTLMFRGVQSQPTVESWGGRLYRGWNATYEFAYKRNPATINFPGFGEPAEVDLGWDIAVPVTGFNCRAFAPDTADADEDVFGQPLRHINGKIVPPPLLPEQIDHGDRVRAMVKVFEYEDGGTSQAPSASPIALKENGRPLKTHDANGNLVNKPLVYGYQVQEDYDFKLLGPAGNRLFR